jgi:hypothetical protein
MVMEEAVCGCGTLNVLKMQKIIQITEILETVEDIE